MANIQINIDKNGTTTLATVGHFCDRNIDVNVDVPTTGGGDTIDIPDSAFVITGDCTYRFYQGVWDWFVENYKDKITTNKITVATNMFNGSKLEELPFNLDFTDGGCNITSLFTNSNFKTLPSIDFKHGSVYKDSATIFSGCNKLESIGTLKNLHPSSLQGCFKQCTRLRYLPEIENWNLERIQTYGYGNASSMFDSCSSLREIPESFLKQIYTGTSTSQYYAVMNAGFCYCYALDEIRGLNPRTGRMQTNMFSSTFSYCERVKNIIFATQEDGTPYTVEWKSQSINLANRCGWSGYNSSNDRRGMCTIYNSGITQDKEVKNAEDYQALKNDPDWFSVDVAYSRYNHDSAVATINSLPDTSAYLASAGGSNTIKFMGDAGSATDGGAVGNLTAEEIAVAVAKGWTVTFTYSDMPT